MPQKNEAIERVADHVVLADTRDDIVKELDYLWNEAIQQSSISMGSEIAVKIARDLEGDAEFQDKFLKMKADTYREAARAWFEDYFGEWQGRELFEKMNEMIEGE